MFHPITALIPFSTHCRSVYSNKKLSSLHQNSLSSMTKRPKFVQAFRSSQNCCESLSSSQNVSSSIHTRQAKRHAIKCVTPIIHSTLLGYQPALAPLSLLERPRVEVFISNLHYNVPSRHIMLSHLPQSSGGSLREDFMDNVWERKMISGRIFCCRSCEEGRQKEGWIRVSGDGSIGSNYFHKQQLLSTHHLHALCCILLVKAGTKRAARAELFMTSPALGYGSARPFPRRD